MLRDKPAGLRVEIDVDLLIGTLSSRYEAQFLPRPIRETMGLVRTSSPLQRPTLRHGERVEPCRPWTISRTPHPSSWRG